ncbi:MAG: hypothetical protein HN348_32280, partial [Proteobacteria bacterium]|nr:hypothetical protein [Pseudomonadota bacterium]
KKNQNKTAQQRKVISWLGETGATDAIPALVKVYRRAEEGDPIHQAAAYALGQFRALDKAIVRAAGDNPITALEDGEENMDLYDQLEDARLHGKIGKRKSLPLSAMMGIAGALGVILMILLVVNLAFGGGPEEVIVPTRVGGDGDDPGHGAVLDSLSMLRTIVNENLMDAETLQEQFGGAIINRVVDCETTFLLRQPYTPPGNAMFTYPDLADWVAQVEETSTALNLAINQHNDICQRAMSPHIGVLRENSEMVTAYDGALTLLAQYWGEVDLNGTTDKCHVTQPTIPEDYTGIPQDLLDRQSGLKQTKEQVDLAMELLRDSWIAFDLACENDSFEETVAAARSQVTAAREAFASAEAFLSVADGEVAYTDAVAVTQTLDSALETLPILEENLLDIESQVLDAKVGSNGALIIPTPPPTETPAPTDTPIPIPTETLEPAAIAPHVNMLRFNIEFVTSPREGALTLLTQYWTDVGAAGTTVGCQTIQPEIPEDYTIPQDVVDQLPVLG